MITCIILLLRSSFTLAHGQGFRWHCLGLDWFLRVAGPGFHKGKREREILGKKIEKLVFMYVLYYSEQSWKT